MEHEFELPQTKRIRRSDLDSRSPTSSARSSPIPAPISSQDLSQSVSLSIPTFSVPVIQDDLPVNSEATYEFRLFRPSAKSADADAASFTQKITVRSPTPASELGVGGFLGPQRPLSHYLTSHVDEGVREERMKRFKLVAMEGDDVLGKGLGSCVWKGCELQWKVVHIQVQRASRSKSLPSGSGGGEIMIPETSTSAIRRKRSRAGKKKRIARRKATLALGAKELAGKEKKARKNSRKKARKREKVKAKKEVVDGADAD